MFMQPYALLRLSGGTTNVDLRKIINMIPCTFPLQYCSAPVGLMQFLLVTHMVLLKKESRNCLMSGNYFILSVFPPQLPAAACQLPWRL